MDERKEMAVLCRYVASPELSVGHHLGHQYKQPCVADSPSQFFESFEFSIHSSMGAKTPRVNPPHYRSASHYRRPVSVFKSPHMQC
ncbi:MAG: hypothetical protein KZQ97_08230 [Candidatus Thiodiazotropha sp. (ex Dulcina madagascariensis)]|nr:hypothetical protein [Candidatus Thiodiazotropha sp. (ex Dulcina madagascariensis)]